MNYESEFIRWNAGRRIGQNRRNDQSVELHRLSCAADAGPLRAEISRRGDLLRRASMAHPKSRRLARRARHRPDDVVAVMMKNSAAFLELAFAASHLGAVFLPINFRLAADEVGYIVDNAGAQLLIADEEFAAAVANGRRTVSAGRSRAGRHHALAGMPRRRRCTSAQPSDLLRLMYTSGTTDRPKGVMHTYENFYWKMRRSVDRARPQRETTTAGGRAALPCRRLRSARHRRAVGRRHALYPSRFRRRSACSPRSRLRSSPRPGSRR